MILTIILLLVFGVSLVLLEIVLPGGVIGGIGILCIVAGIVCSFIQSPTMGVGVLVGAFVFFMITFWAWLKFLPKIPIAKGIFLNKTAEGWSGTEAGNNDYLNKEGTAQTVLRPAGFATIDGERVDVVSQGEMIQKGEPIKVIEVEGNRIVVARLSDC